MFLGGAFVCFLLLLLNNNNIEHRGQNELPLVME